MSASGLIVFRLFSGPHIGAELVLPAGNQLVGSDDSCDIILQDSSVASRHANIVIGFSGDGAPSVRVTPLDGEILLNGAPLPSDGADIPARTPFFLGLTCMAWSEPGEPADAWRQVASGLQERRSVQERPEPAEPQREEPVMDLGDPMILLEEGTSVGANGVGKTLWERLRSLPPQRLALSFFLLLGLCGLTFSYAGRTPDAETRVKEIQTIIDENGFRTLVVSPQDEGVGVQGVLRDDAERADLLRLAQGVQYPVYLDVTLRGDRVDAVTSAFASRGFSLSVQEKTDNPDDGLDLAGYMKDGLVEEQAFSAVREDVPELRDQAVWSRLDRTIRHADAVEAVLLPLLKEADLAFVQVRFLPGKVELAGRFDVVASFENKRPQAEVRREAAAPQQAEAGDVPAPQADDMPEIRVTGVTLTPMHFISLATGQRVFEGGLLPGGYVLESIGVKELKLRKDGRIIVYRLRGSNE